MVRAAFRRAELPAAVLLVNAGTGSTAYRRALFVEGRFHEWLDAVDEELTRRGLRQPKRRRLALTAWSAGYGGVGQVLTREPNTVDAVVLLDGLHTHRDGPALARAPLEPFVAHAHRARDGDAFFLLTHSSVSPEKETTASTYRCADWLLRQVGVTRFGRRELIPAITEAPRARPMHLQSDAREGGFVVQGYAGDEPGDHMAHLQQMAAVGLAELKRHWSAPKP